MNRVLLTVAVSWLLVCAQDASAQRRVPGFRTGNTISPYTQFFAPNNGGLNQYFSFVRPQMQLNQLSQAQRLQAYELNQTMQIQNRILLDPGFAGGTTALPPGAVVPPLGSTVQLRPSTAAGALGTPHASYFNYGNFYNYPIQPPSTGRGARLR